MKLSDAEVRELFQRKTAQAGSPSSECLGEEVLIRAAGGDLDSTDRDRVAGHIARCSDCAREFRIVRSMAALESAARREFPAARPGWMAIAAGVILAIALPALVWMAVERQRDAAAIHSLRNDVRALRGRPPVVTATTAPQAHHLESLQTTIAELSRLQIDVPIVDLDADVVRGPNEPTQIVSMPPSAQGVTLILHLPEPTSETVAIEVLGDGGSIVASDSAPAKPGRSNVTVVLRKKVLSEGKNVIRLRSQGKTSTFHFRVDYS